MLFSSFNKLKTIGSRSSKSKFAKSGSLLVLGGIVTTSVFCTTVFAYGDEEANKAVAKAGSNDLETIRAEIMTRLDVITKNIGLDQETKKEFLVEFFPHVLNSDDFAQVLKNHTDAENRVLCEKGSSVFIDHTILAANVTSAQIDTLCNEAKEYNFKAVCVQGSRVPQAVANVAKSNIEVAAVVGFPLGASSSQSKAYEAYEYILEGASEIDMVIDIGSIKDKDYHYAFNDVLAVNNVVQNMPRTNPAILKVIIECALLNREEIIDASIICVMAGAAYVKTSTGFSLHGATEEHVKLMKLTVGNNTKVKAAGGVRDKKALVSMINQGASRIGTSSGTKLILSPSEAQQQIQQLNQS
jgi:deoxyribose-phosphate aldolase